MACKQREGILACRSISLQNICGSVATASQEIAKIVWKALSNIPCAFNYLTICTFLPINLTLE
jgi:hypothetical protein